MSKASKASNDSKFIIEKTNIQTIEVNKSIFNKGITRSKEFDDFTIYRSLYTDQKHKLNTQRKIKNK